MKKPHVEIRTVDIADSDSWNPDFEEIEVFVDGVSIGGGSFGSEPEDNSRGRDYSWVDDTLSSLAEALGATVSFTEVLNEEDEDEEEEEE